MTAPDALLAAALALLGWVYAGYPLLLALLVRIAPVRPVASPAPDVPPSRVSVAIAVHDEAERIEGRIADILAQGWPDLEVLVGADGCTDATPAIVARLAAADPRVRLLALQRGGQTATQNALVEAATGELVILSDAETRFAPGCLAALVAPFADPRIGCVTGRLSWSNREATGTARSEGLYWRYEHVVRELESRTGFLTAVTGALLAFRRALYRPVPAAASVDHLLPLFVREQGRLVWLAPGATARDRGIADPGEQLRNRSRTATRGIRANLAMTGRLAPWRHPRSALAIWSHKILRWATPWLLLAAAIAGLPRLAVGEPLLVAGYAVAGVVTGLALAGWLVAARRGRAGGPPRLSRWLALPLSIAIVNAAFAVGWLNLLRGRRIEAWHRAEWEAR